MWREIAEISEFLDANTSPAFQKNATLGLYGRVAKVAEESGEAMSALIGFTGQNPRKGYSNTAEDVVKELLDVALTALCAIEHIRDELLLLGAATTEQMLADHITRVHNRLIGTL
jgi:hypothetical protein